MQAPHPQERVAAPRPLDVAANDDRASGFGIEAVRSQGFAHDLGPVEPQPIPDWDWGPDKERRA